MSLSRLARSIAESPTLRLNEEARILRERGEDVINLGIGEPKNRAPITAILSAASKLSGGDVKYTPTDGHAVAEEGHHPLHRGELRSAGGARERDRLHRRQAGAVHTLLFTLLNPQDEVILLAPYWVSYPEMIRMVYGVPVVVTPEDGTFQPRLEDIERAVSALHQGDHPQQPEQSFGR